MPDKTYKLLPETGSFADYVTAVHSLRNTAAEFYKAKSQIVHPVFVRDDGSLIFRPLTFRENLQARVEDFETKTNPDGTKRSMEDRLTLFHTFLDSCTGTVYKAGITEKFKIVPLCMELATIAPGFSKPHIPKDYGSIDGTELDISKAKYWRPLTKKEVPEHPAWLAATEEDKPLLKAYLNIIFKALKQEKAMGFWPRREITEDQLRALYSHILGNSSDANDSNDLSDSARLLLAQPKSK